MMKGNGKVIFVVLIFFVMLLQREAGALVVINEILADPATGLSRDANGDGVGSSTQDEFVEILNLDPHPFDISGWFINDAVKTRHVFPAGTMLLSYQYLAVFGGGTPVLPGIRFQTASSGALSLNNTNEDVFLYDQTGVLIGHVFYGAEGGKDQSIVRFPEGTGSDFVLHSSLPEAQGRLFSPGQSVDGELRYKASVPELPVIFILPEGH